MINIFDKAIEVLAPQVAVKRSYARHKMNVMNSGYSNYGASQDRKASKGWRWWGGGPKEDIDDNVDVLRQRSCDNYYGVPIATSALKTTRTNVVGSGLKARPNLDAEFLGMTEEEAAMWERGTMREFALWADNPNCDLERLNNFCELQQLAFLSWLMNGDVFVLLPFTTRVNMPYDLRVQLIEAHRVCNPRNNFTFDRDNTVEGVERLNGEIFAYYIANFHPLSSQHTTNRTWNRVIAYGPKTGRRNVLHCMISERIGQSRGIPLLSPVIESLKQLGRYTDAELMAAVISGMFTVFIETPTPEQKAGGYTGDKDEENDSEDEMSLGTGSIVQLEEGQKANIANPGRPNTAFDGFVTSITRQIGAALEIPPELLLKQFTSSYSASRGALLEAWKTFRMYRSWLSNDFCQPIYEEWLSEAVSKGRVYAPGFFTDPLVRKAYCKCDWSGPSPGQLDPVREANAAKIRVEEGFSTRQQETVEMNGGDFFENNRQRIREENARKEIPSFQGSIIEVKEGKESEED